MGCSLTEYEAMCEVQYEEYLQSAIRQIERGEFPYTPRISPRVYGYIDFDTYYQVQMSNEWTLKLDNAVEKYKLQYEQTKALEKAAEEERESAAKARKQAKEQFEREEKERKALEWERQEQERREREKQEREKQRTNSLKVLMGPSYNMSQADAGKFINDAGEINKVELDTFLNAKRNKEEIARKAAEWKMKKAKRENLISDESFVCPVCGHPAIINDRFCRACGTQLQKECPSCKKLLPVSNKFCSGCGTKL